MTNPVEIIRQKRDGNILSKDDLQYFFTSYLSGNVTDYQVSAWLMAAFIQGLHADEVAHLTEIMCSSGKVLSWPERSKVVDKHSTGGVGDKTSLIILPLCCLEGVTVPMISGRGLGHTGGTLDKLESIPGMDVFLTETKARKTIESHGGAFMGQTSEFAPLDKKLYALRDVTGTVESIGLITASILSKKLAEGIGALSMDVKFGSGAFMPTYADALALANSIISVAQKSDLKISCVLSDMNSPLGRSAGNALEVKECVDVLKGQGPADTRKLSLRLSAEMVHLCFPDETLETIQQRLEDHLDSGRAFEKFKAVIAAQGGDPRSLDDCNLLPTAPHQHEVTAASDGFIEQVNVRELGMVVVDLKGGRTKAEDLIDPAVGLTNLKQVGERVVKGEPLAVMHTNEGAPLSKMHDRLQAAFVISSQQPQTRNLIAEVIHG